LPGDYVVKILHLDRPNKKYRLSRFTDETQFLRDNPEQPGILPLVDSSISTDLTEHSWYVMPKAIPMRSALGEDPAIETVLEAIAQIAETLADLARRGIGHRDIKPDNLFQLKGAWVLGDFGLVTYPEKDPELSTAVVWVRSTTWPRRCVKTQIMPSQNRRMSGP